jgi:hypothetical protein
MILYAVGKGIIWIVDVTSFDVCIAKVFYSCLGLIEGTVGLILALITYPGHLIYQAITALTQLLLSVIPRDIIFIFFTDIPQLSEYQNMYVVGLLQILFLIYIGYSIDTKK